MTIQEYNKLKIGVNKLSQEIRRSAINSGVDTTTNDFEYRLEQIIKNFIKSQSFSYEDYLFKKSQESSVNSAIDEGQVVRNAEMLHFINSTKQVFSDMGGFKKEIDQEVKDFKKSIKTEIEKPIKWEKISNKPKIITDQEVEKIIKTEIEAIPQGKNETTIALEASKMAQEAIKPIIPTIDDVISNLAPQLPKLGESIRDGLELLEGSERLNKSAIDGLDDYEEISLLARKPKVFGSAGLKELIAGTNITVDNTKLGYPVISASGGGTSDHFVLSHLAYAESGHTGFQSTLVSGTSIKTINSTSLLGSGDITVLTSLSGAVLTDQTIPQTIGLTGSRLAKLWVTDITCTNAITGSVTGNAGTVTNGIYTTSDVTALAATSAGNKDKYLHSNASTGALEWNSGVAGGTGISRTVETKSSDATAGSTAQTDYVYFVTGTTTITLPTAVGNTNRYTIKSISGTTVVACNGAETIDGTATIGIANEDSVDLISNNTEWKVI